MLRTLGELLKLAESANDSAGKQLLRATILNRLREMLIFPVLEE